MSLSLLPAVPTQDLTITDDGHQFFLTLWILASSAPCPHCGQLSSHVHSTYTRQVHDLPWSDAPVSVELVVPKWWCDHPDCPQSIFCMRLTPWVPAYGRRSVRLTQWLADWAWTTSAEEVAATAARHGVTLSSSTVVRILRVQPDPTFPPPRIVGIDDWAIAKGHGCGSLRGTQGKISTHRQTECDRCSHLADPLGMNSSPRRPCVSTQGKRPRAPMISRYSRGQSLQDAEGGKIS